MENQEQIERLYEKEIGFAEILKNPIFQPISQANTIYESQDRVIKRALFEYKQLIEQITKLMNENPTYQQTIMMSKVRALLQFSQQIIHSQDVQRETIKRCLNDVIKIVEEYFELKMKEKIDFKTEVGKINEYIEKKFDEDDFKEIEEQEKEKLKKSEEKLLKKVEIASELVLKEDENFEELTKENIEEKVNPPENLPSMKPRKENLWLKHVEGFNKEHPELSRKNAIIEAKKTYIPLEKEKEILQEPKRRRGRPRKLKDIRSN